MAHSYLTIEISGWICQIHKRSGGQAYHILIVDGRLDLKALEDLHLPNVSAEDLQLEVYVLGEYEPPSEEHFLPSQRSDPLMNPPAGVERPLGWIQVWPEDELLLTHLYVGANVFDDLWMRHANGGPMPHRLKISFEGITYGEADTCIWDWQSNNRLPIVFFDFCARANVGTVRPSP